MSSATIEQQNAVLMKVYTALSTFFNSSSATRKEFELSDFLTQQELIIFGNIFNGRHTLLQAFENECHLVVQATRPGTNLSPIPSTNIGLQQLTPLQQQHYSSSSPTAPMSGTGQQQRLFRKRQIEATSTAAPSKLLSWIQQHFSITAGGGTTASVQQFSSASNVIVVPRSRRRITTTTTTRSNQSSRPSILSELPPRPRRTIRPTIAVRENAESSLITEEHQQHRRRRLNDTSLLVETRTDLVNALKLAAGGITPTIPLESQPAMLNNMNLFIKKQFTQSFYTCIHCNERNLLDHEILDENGMLYVCKRCAQELKDTDNVISFSSANDMDPFFSECLHQQTGLNAETEYQQLLQRHGMLTEVEEMLIAQHCPIMKIYKLKGPVGGQNFGFRGNVINVTQNLKSIVTTLPRIPATIPVFKVRKLYTDGNDVQQYKDFQIHRQKIHEWLIFLKRFNPAYSGIIISEENLNSLPLSDSVSNMIRDLITPIISRTGQAEFDADNNSDNESNDDDGIEDGPIGDNIHRDGEDAILETGIGVHNQQQDSFSVDEGDAIRKILLTGTDKFIHDTSPDDDHALQNDPNLLEDSDGEEEKTAIEQDHINNNTNEQQPRNLQQEHVQTLLWPTQGSVIDEYSTSWLLTKSFPSLFPFGNGDVTCLQNRRKSVSLKDALEHYQRYAIRKDDGTWVWPFSRHHRFMHYLQDMDERHRVNAQANIYIKQNPNDANLTINDLKEAARTSLNPTLFAMTRRIQRYAGNILGSDSYMAIRKKELLGLMQYEGIPTIWFTLSLANAYWLDLQRLFGPPLALQENETDEAFKLRQHQHYLSNYVNNPHVVDEVFCKRVQTFVEHFFGSDGLDTSWYWYRYEWQRRGNIHTHGVAKLKSDPNLVQLSKLVIKGRKAQQLLQSNKKFRNQQQQTTSYDDYHFKEHPHDSYMVVLAKSIDDFYQENSLSDEQQLELFSDLATGDNAELCLCTYRDYMLSSTHPNPPLDAKEIQREDADTRPPFIGEHICSTCHLSGDSYGINSLNYEHLLNWCQRHRHNKGYCLRCGACRFNFPRPLLQETLVGVAEIDYKKGELKGTYRRTTVTIHFRSNDRWLNSHPIIGLLAWGANMDMSILIDEKAILEYVTKYCTKNEKISNGLNSILQTAIRKRTMADGDVDTKKILRTFFNLFAKRDKCTQEIAHLAASRPIAVCSHNFVQMNLTSELRRVNSDGADGPTRLLQRNIIDYYEYHRLDKESWADPTVFHLIEEQLIRISLHKFVRLYSISLKSDTRKIVLRRNSDKTIPIFSPEINSLRTNPSYWAYCWISLRKYKPYVGDPESVYDGSIDDAVRHTHLDKHTPANDIQNKIINAWESYILENSTNTATTTSNDGLQREIDRLRQKGELDEIIRESQLSNDHSLSVDVENQLDYFEVCQRLRDDEFQGLESLQWANQFDFTIPNENYISNEFSKQHIDQQWMNLVNPNAIMMTNTNPTMMHQRPNRRIVELGQCNVQQREAALVWKQICVQQNAIPERSVTEDSRFICNAMIINGVGGTGKSFLIDAMIHQTNLFFDERGNNTKTVLVMAPTGKAALNASGVTLHSNNGLSIPILSLGKGNDLKGDALLRLQQRFEHISAIIIDERSMLSLVDFYWIDRRCRQATKQSHKPFGGLPIAFIGDPGQLPPVGGLSLWEDKTSQNTRITGIQAIASELYKRINTVMNLTEVRRQENQTSVQFLNRLRDGKCTEIDWQWLQHNCTAESIKQRLGEQAFKDKFQSSNTLHIYFRNADTNLHNIEQIQSVRNPILLINAKHDSTSSKQRSTEHTQHLPAKIYLCRGAKIMLLRNISTVNGLVNGSTGTVIDFLYEEAQTAPTLPYSILINFPDYNGTPFFTAPGQEKWVPILNERYSWGENNQHYRISFPITLCYAITAWKSQGMTLTVPVYTKLGNKEPEHGCTYVVLSRPKDLENLCIHNGITLDRITTAISNGKKLKRRLKEDNRLQDLYQQTRERFMHVFL